MVLPGIRANCDALTQVVCYRYSQGTCIQKQQSENVNSSISEIHCKNLNVCVSPFRSTHHGLISVLLKLDQANPGDVLQIHVSVGAVWGVSVQVRRSGWRGHPQRLVAIDLVGHHIVGLQQSLERTQTSWMLRRIHPNAHYPDRWTQY